MKSVRFVLAVLGLLSLIASGAGCTTKKFARSSPRVADLTEQQKAWEKELKDKAFALTDEELMAWKTKYQMKLVLGFTDCRDCHKKPTAKKTRRVEIRLRDGTPLLQ